MSTGIAVIGLAGRFPDAPDVETLWRNLCRGVESIVRLDADRLAAAGVGPERAAAPGFVPAGAIFEGIPMFDAGLFGFSPRDAAVLDPQHRHFLECSWTALEHAGHRPESFDGVIGVFAGSGINAYLWTNVLANAAARSAGFFLLRHTGNDKDFLTTRVSYCLGLTGPSVNVQTACSTSLVAIHAACQSLLLGECDMALAGGVTIELPNGAGYTYEEGGILSPDGHCRAFDVQAAGTVLGSAAGVVVLRRLTDALEDGDTVHAVIRGSAINNDGALKAGYLAPSVEGQARAAAIALALADVDAETITFLEAHGTGTPVGDPIEVAALTRALRTHTDRRGFCALGSVKGNIGHTDTAAGVAGFIKAVLALEHGVIPPTLHFERPNPLLDLDDSPFHVNASAQLWPRVDGAPRRAAVNSLGVGGTNAFVVLEEAPETGPSGPSRQWQVLPLSGRSPDVVARLRTLLADRLDAGAPPLPDVAWTLARGRKPMRYRAALVARDGGEALEALLTAGRARREVVDAGDAERRVCFLFAGGGAQHVGMGAALHSTEAVFRDAIEDCLARLDARLAQDVRAVLLTAPADAAAIAAGRRPSIALPALFAVQYASARLWQSLGVRPAAMIGHSLGEYTAACLAGVFSLDDALAVVALRGRLFETLPTGAMTSVQLGEDALAGLLHRSTSIAASNAADLCVASGPVEAIEDLERRLAEREIGFRRIHIDVAAHSPLLDPVLDEFRAFLRTLRLRPAALPFASNRSGTWIRPEDAMSPDYWVAHLREPVRFAEGLATLLSDTDAVLLEVGPGRTLATLARVHPGCSPDRPVLTSLPHPGEAIEDTELLARTTGALWECGVSIDWQAWFAGEQRRRVPLPTYPFEHQPYWIEPDVAPVAETAPPEAVVRPDIADWFSVQTWREVAPLEPGARAAGNWLVFGGPGGWSESVARALSEAGARTLLVEAGPGFAAPGPLRFRIDPDSIGDYERLLREVRATGPIAGIVHLWALDGAVGQTDSAVRAQYAFTRGLHLLQALAAADADHDTDLVFCTSGAQPVGADPVTSPEWAPLLGLARVAPRELPGLYVRTLDIDSPRAPSWPWRRTVQHIVAECLNRTADRAVAYRGARRWLPVLETLRVPGQAGLLRERGVYLITGGTGGIGLAIAEDLARTHGARLVLVARNPLPAEHRLRIEDAGGEVLAEAADVTDAEAMRAVVRRTIDRFGALHGVIHAAGVLRDAPLLSKTPADAVEVLAPKVAGAVVLDRVLEGIPLDFRVHFSSVSALAGPAGQVDYAAANAFLDAWAHYTCARDGIPTISAAWGAWRDVGMAARLAGPHGEAADHPWLDRIERTPGGEVRAFATLYADAPWTLDEHRDRDGTAVLPGAAYLELVSAAWTATGGGLPCTFRDISFFAPLTVPDGQSRPLRVRLMAGSAAGEFTVSSRAVCGEPWQVYARGFIGRGATGRGRLPLEEIRARCADRLERVVAPPAHVHLRLGHRWDALRAIAYGEAEALLSLELPSDLCADLPDHVLHPALLDLATAGAQALIEGRTADDFFVPASYGSLLLYDRLPGRLWSHVRYRASHTERPDIAVFDVTLADAGGRVIAEIGDFVMVRVSHAALAGRSAAIVDDTPGEDRLARQSGPDLTEAIRTDAGVEAFRRVLSRASPRHVIISPADPLAVPAGDTGVGPAALRREEGNGRPTDAPDLTPLEETLLRHPAVREAAALVHRDRSGDRVVAFVVPDRGAGATATELRRHVRAMVPAALVPASFVELHELPRGTDGSIDRAALPNPFARNDDFAPPTTPTELLIASVWSGLLGLDRVSALDNFFDIGGHSLIGVRALVRIAKETGVRLNPNALMLQTLRQMAAEIDRGRVRP